MTENEIINDLECCVRSECDRCSRKQKEGCKDELMKHALWVSKMLRDAYEEVNRENEQVNAYNESLKATARFEFSLKDLVKRVNAVIEASFEHGCGEGGSDYGNWDGLICAVTNLMCLVDKDDELVLAVDRHNNANIQFKK